MYPDRSRRSSAVHSTSIGPVPLAPPLPTPRPLQRARDAASRFFSYSSRPVSPHSSPDDDRGNRGPVTRYASLSAAQNATASHRTGLEINTLSINERGTHALVGGKEIFKTIRIENGTCAEDVNLRSAIRSTPKQASGQVRQIYSIDIADVAWAKGDCGNYVAAATSSGKIILYNIDHAGLEAARLYQLYEHVRQVHRITFNPHRGNLLLSGSQDGTVRLWDVRDSEQASTLQSKRKYSGQNDGVRDVKWSPTEGLDFAFGTDSGWIQRWDLRNLKTAKVKIPAHSQTCSSIDWHPDGKHIASAGPDKTVKVWDFSANRSRKAAWEIRTPHPIVNARWRPPCESSMPGNSGARQSTQLVTAYDSSHPMLHIWDLRRPAVPFRELWPYQSAPTDMLWHSQDLLWTVGREGIFLQTDIQHAAKTMSSRNLQAFDISPHGEINIVTHRRQKQPRFRQSQISSLLSKSSSTSQSPEQTLLSRSWTDDSLDHSFLSALPFKSGGSSVRHSRAPSINVSGSAEKSLESVVTLDDILQNRRSTRPQQVACRGLIPMIQGPLAFAYLAKNYTMALNVTLSEHNLIETVSTLLQRNSAFAAAAGLYRTSQTWRMFESVVVNHLRARAGWRAKQSSEDALDSRMPMLEGRLREIALRVLQEYDWPAITSEPKVQTVVSARPPNMLKDVRHAHAHTAEASLAHDVTSDVPKNRVPIDRASPKNKVRPATRSALSAQIKQTNQSLTSTNLNGLQQQQQPAAAYERDTMVRKWSVQTKEPLAAGIAGSGDSKAIPGMLEKHHRNESFTFLGESLESPEPSFPSSLVSNGPDALHLVAERPSRINQAVGSNHDLQKVDNAVTRSEFAASSAIEIPKPVAPPRRSDDRSDLAALNADGPDKNFDNAAFAQHRSPNNENLGLGSYPDENGICFQIDGSEELPQKDTTRKADIVVSPYSSATKIARRESVSTEAPSRSALGQPGEQKFSHYLGRDADVDLEEGRPFTLVAMLQELLNYYTATGDAQTATHLLTLTSLLPTTHPLPPHEIEVTLSSYLDQFTGTGYTHEEMLNIVEEQLEPLLRSGLQPLQIEAVLSTYHDQLVARGLFAKATQLRKMSFPLYPAVYQQSLKDNNLRLGCSSCGKPIVNKAPSLRCEVCTSERGICSICWSSKSPLSSNGTYTDNDSRLMTACLICNHSSHTSCLHAWFHGTEDGGCPTEGCLCDCVAGAWRQEKGKIIGKKQQVKVHGMVKSDDWKITESKAVTRARNVLSAQKPAVSQSNASL